MARERLVIDLTPFSKPRRFKRAPKKAPKSFTLVKESIQHGEILPASLASSRGCCTKMTGKKGCEGPPRPGQVELVFVRRSTDEGAPKPGPALRICTGKGEGELIPVRDPREAKKLAQQYQACVGESRAKQKACIARVA